MRNHRDMRDHTFRGYRRQSSPTEKVSRSRITGSTPRRIPQAVQSCFNSARGAKHAPDRHPHYPAPPRWGARPTGGPTGDKEPAMADETETGTPAPHPVPHAQTGHGPRAVPLAESNPSRWGRVDDEGNVYVRTADGERAIGVWQAGTAEEGLLHFARRFDDLRTEVELLETRLSSGAGDPKHAVASATQLRGSLADAAVVGDLDALGARLD